MIYISPSLLAADFNNLGAEVKRIEDAGADYLHLDVMDGVFVPNISFGLPVIESLRKTCGLIFDVHLMITNPERYVEKFANAGADIITFHYEACDDPAAAIKKIKELGKKASISISPKTPAESILPYIPELDMVLVMTVEPGFGGQSLIPETIEKVKVIRKVINENGYNCNIQVDGGIDKNTIGTAAKAGANNFVAGSALFKQDDYGKAVSELRLAAK